MASTTATYGKKRNLLKPLGSRRRREKRLTPPSPKTKLIISEPFNFTVNTPHYIAKKMSLQWPIGNPTTAEEIASALLEDTKVESEGRSESSPRDDTIKSASSDPFSPDNHAEDIVEARRSSRSLSLPPRHLDLPSDIRLGTSKLQKFSPKPSKKVLTRACSARPRANSGQRKESGLLRPFLETERLSLDLTQYRSGPGVKKSRSVPLSAIANRKSADSFIKKQASATPGESTVPDEINDKIYAMLAASNALKPSPMESGLSSASRISRMASFKVFSKVSTAWERFNSRNSLQESNSRGKLRKFPVNEESDGLIESDVACDSPGAVSPSSISTIEIRLNEGGNLNKKKVQQMVGGQVIRKSVPKGGKSLRDDQSPNNSSAESSRPQTPIANEDMQAITEEDDANNTSLPLQNPFESELGFENNLEDGILNAMPAGSSTPRIKIHRASSSTLDDITEIQESPVNIQLGLARIARNPGEVRWIMAGSPRTAPEHEEQIVPLRSGVRLGVNMFRTGTGREIQESRRMKKHPSPSKKELEDLEVDFRRYTRLKSMRADHELDELARSTGSPTPLLAKRDRNQLMASRAVRSDLKPFTPRSSKRNSRIPRPTEESAECRSKMRLAHPYRPTLLQADDADELQ